MEEFKRLPRFPRKMVLYSSTNLGILKPLTIISNHIRFDLGFSQTSKQIDRKLKYRDSALEEFERLPRFARKVVFVFVNQIWHFKAFNHYFQPYKIRFRLLTGFKTIL